MSLAIGVLLGLGIAAALAAAWRLRTRPAGLRARRRRSACSPRFTPRPRPFRICAAGCRSAPPKQAVPHLRALTGAAAIALADVRRVLAIDGEGREQVRPGDLLSRLLASTRDDRLNIVPALISSDPTCPLRSAVLAPADGPGQARRDADRLLPHGGAARATTSCAWSRRQPAWSRRRSSCRFSASRRSGWRRRSCGRCARRSRRTSSTTPWPPWPATSTPAPRRRGSC